MSNILVILITVLAFLLGIYVNYERWRMSGKIYKAAAKRTEQCKGIVEDLTKMEVKLKLMKVDLKLAKRENLKLISENERLKQGIIKCK